MPNIHYKKKALSLFLPLSVSVMDSYSIVTVIHVFWARYGGLNVSEFPSRSPSLQAHTLLQAKEKKNIQNYNYKIT